MAALGAKYAVARRVERRWCIRRRNAARDRGKQLKRTSFIVIATIFLAACASAPQTPMVVAPQGNDRYLVDPRIGFTGKVPPQLDRKFERIWRFIEAGQSSAVR